MKKHIPSRNFLDPESQERRFAMFDYTKYKRQYFMPPEECFDWARKDHVEKAPVWCSVDLHATATSHW